MPWTRTAIDTQEDATMGFFKRLFAKGVTRDEWDRVAEGLCIGYGLYRQGDFAGWVQLGRREGIPIANANLGGTGELAMIGYQLFCTAHTIAAQGYVANHEGKDFADILWAQAAGERSVLDVIPYAERYREKGDDSAALHLGFALDIAAYITGVNLHDPDTDFATEAKEATYKQAVWLAMQISFDIPRFTAILRRSVAHAFRDD
jgi:hypothetical protein